MDTVPVRAQPALGHAILLYDGECGLCHGLVQWLWQRDRSGHIYFVSLQSELAQALLQRHGVAPTGLDTVWWIETLGSPQEQLHQRSSAALRSIIGLGGFYRLGHVALWLPRGLRDWVYDAIAQRRYRWFGRQQACLLPPPHVRIRFLA